MKGDVSVPDQHKVFLYALSTCGHCRHAREWLDENKVDYDYVYVDQVSPEERNKILEDTKDINPRRAFPALVIDDGARVIVGFREDEYQEALGT